MENTTSKKHLFIDKKVRAIKDKASYLINIDDICRKMEWDDKTREYLFANHRMKMDGWIMMPYTTSCIHTIRINTTNTMNGLTAR